MPIEIAVWKLGKEPQKVAFTSIDSEKKLEEILVKDISLVSPNLMLLGRQVATAYGKFIDLLAMDRDGNVSVIGLKKNRTPRDVGKHGYPPDKRQEAVDTVIEQAEQVCREWGEAA